MRRLVTMLGVMALALLATAQVATAQLASATQPRVGPPLSLSVDFKPGGSEVLVVAGRGCRPVQDAPASVLVTVQELPGEVFTATPDPSGHWSVEAPIADPNDFSLTIDAECDDYYGTMNYPQAGLGVAGTSVVATPSAPGSTRPAHGNGPVTANTGNSTGIEVGIGLVMLLVGAALLKIGLPRRA